MLQDGLRKEKVPILSFFLRLHTCSQEFGIFGTRIVRVSTFGRTRRHQIIWFAFRTNDNAQPDSELT